MRRTRMCAHVAALVVIVVFTASGQATGWEGLSPTDHCSAFMENAGQVSEEVLYYLVSPAVTVYFTREAVVFDLKEAVATEATLRSGATGATRSHGPIEKARHRGCAVWLRFDGASSDVEVAARNEVATRFSYFPNGDRDRWLTNVRAFGEITYHDLWPGIDVTYRAEQGCLTYEITASERADPRNVSFVYEGAEAVTAGETGALSIATPVRSFTELRAVAGRTKGVIRWSPGTDATTESSSDERDDPLALLWSTFLGGDDGDWCEGLALDSAGNVVVVGSTYSTDFPSTPGVYDESGSFGVDVFVSKVGASGDALLWSTFVGGEGWHEAEAVALDPNGNPIVTGRASGSSFPTTPGAFEETHSGSMNDGFVFKLSADGSDLIWSTFLGGSGDWDCGYAVELDALGRPVVAGVTGSPDFPTTPGAYDESHNGDEDVFACRLSADGSALQWCTLLGGAMYDWLNGMALDSTGNVSLTGRTAIMDFPTPEFPTTPGAFDELRNDIDDAFVSMIDASGSQLLWSTFLGGDGTSRGYAVTFAPSGNPVVTGSTSAADFPTTAGAYDETHNGGSDMFITEFNASGSALVWSTFLGGSGGGSALSFDSCGNLVVAGGGVYVARLDSLGSELQWSNSVGSGTCTGLALDSEDFPVVAGYTSDSGYPTTPGAYDTTFAEYVDTFVTKLDASGCDSAVEGYVFATESGHERIVLRWGVASLHGISGFNVYRAVGQEGPFQRVNEQVLDPESPGVFEDVSVWPGTTFWYELRAVSVDGHEEEVGTGPVCATTTGRLTAALHPPYPNPFSRHTNVVFDVPSHVGPMSLSVYNVRGQLVKELAGRDTGVGRHSAKWDGTDARGGRVPSGVYFLRLSVGDSTRTEKLMLVR